MRILIFGASGYAGREIKSRLSKKFKNVFGTYHNLTSEMELNDATMYAYDLSDTNSLNTLLAEVKPNIIVYCLRGDFAQQLSAIKIMAQYIENQKEGKMVFLSSANVFDGALDAPHYEEDPTNAETEYGKFKIECENILQSAMKDKSVIIRIPEIYGENCPRLTRLKMASDNHETVKTFKNIFVNYTTNDHIANCILYILQHDLTGIFHIGTEDMSDYYAFQVMLLKSLEIPFPLFSIEEEKEKIYQAVLSHRRDIPDLLKITVKDVVEEMKIL